jgi:hypothetical protein
MKTIQLFILTAISLYSATFKPAIQCIVEDNHSDAQVEQVSNVQPIELTDYGLISANQKVKPVEPEYNPFDAIPSFK